MTENESSDRQRRKRGTPLERALGALGALLVAALLAFLAYQAIALPDTGPELTTAVTATERAQGQYVAHLRVTNRGGETAEGVSVVGELRVGGKTVGTATTTVAYVPAESSRRAALVFGRDPRDGVLDVRAAGYTVP